MKTIAELQKEIDDLKLFHGIGKKITFDFFDGKVLATFKIYKNGGIKELLWEIREQDIPKITEYFLTEPFVKKTFKEVIGIDVMEAFGFI